MTSAQLDPRTHLFDEPVHEIDAAAALRQQAAERLAAHRARRRTPSATAPAPVPVESPARARASRIAAAVAERYANSQTYHAFLAAQAEAAIREAEAAAEIAAINARAVAAAQLDLLEDIQAELQQEAAQQPQAQQHADQAKPAAHHPRAHKPAATSAPFIPFDGEPAAPPEPLPITIRLYEESPARLTTPVITSQQPILDPMDLDTSELDEEIAFRQAPVFEETVPPVEIPANLIEFPRQLVAPRRARPRRAEGPLLEESAALDEPSQLRIFEVEPTQISPAPAVDSAAPEWSSIMLDAQPVIERRPDPIMVVAEEPAQLLNFSPAAAPLLFTAPLELRLMASAVDSCIILSAMLACATAAVVLMGRLPALTLESTPLAIAKEFAPFAGGLLVAFLILFTLYQVLFFTFSDATPGMRYARIGLCTFSDNNPTRAQMRRRALTFLVSALPAGLGLIWPWIDTDRLTWHDRISRVYQRSY